MDIDIPDPQNHPTSSSFKQKVYDQIDEGVPSWMLDLKLEIVWREENGKELDDYMEEVLA